VTVVVTQLQQHLIKGARGSSVQRLVLGPSGPIYDRRWGFIDEATGLVIAMRGSRGRLLGMRQVGRVQPRITGDSLLIEAPGMPDLCLSASGMPRDGGVRLVTIWGEQIAAYDEGSEAAAWATSYFSRWRLGQYRLVRMGDEARQPSPVGSYTNLTDRWPITLTSEETLGDVQRRINEAAAERGTEPVTVGARNFRVTVVVSGLAPYGEDTPWGFIINGVTLVGADLCVRCEVPDLHPDTLDKRSEPTRTLSRYRRVVPGSNKVALTRNCTIIPAVGRRVISVGDEVTVINHL
jgi:uncharacterized protein YcbX